MTVREETHSAPAPIGVRILSARAVRILASIPPEDPWVVAGRRATLDGAELEASDLEIAEILLNQMPPDPDAEQHRRDLLREVNEHANRGPAGGLSAWRTPAEDRWSDVELRRAVVRWRKGVRTADTIAARRAYYRILKRAARGHPTRSAS